MARPHIEFIQCQRLDWMPQDDGTAIKLLNADPDSSEATMLIRYPAGWQGGVALSAAQEYFVLDGAIMIDGRACGRHVYGFQPREQRQSLRETGDGATLLLFRHAEDDPDSVVGTAEPIVIDTQLMPWDTSTYDPALSYLRLSRKVLRLGPNDSGRTFLLAGLPHGMPHADMMPSEFHEHCEEAFMIHGEMLAPEGVMRPGGYFFRPPRILHGPHVSELGFFQIMRSPGANRIVTHWSAERQPLPLAVPFDPVLPPGSPPVLQAEWQPLPVY